MPHNYNIRQLVSNQVEPTHKSDVILFGNNGNMRSRNQVKETKTSDVDMFRSTLYSSSIAATAYNTTTSKRIPMRGDINSKETTRPRCMAKEMLEKQM